MTIDYSALSDEELQDIVASKPQLSGITSTSGKNCGDALANYLNTTHGYNLPRGGIGPGEIKSLAESKGAPVYSRNDLSPDALTPGTIIHMTRQKGDKNYEYGSTHIGIVDQGDDGPIFRSFTTGKGWKSQRADQRFIDELPNSIVAANPVNPTLTRAELKAGKIAAKVSTIDYSGMTDEELAAIAGTSATGGVVDYSKMSDEELAAIAGTSAETPSDFQTPEVRAKYAEEVKNTPSKFGEIASQLSGPALDVLKVLDIPFTPLHKLTALATKGLEKLGGPMTSREPVPLSGMLGAGALGPSDMTPGFEGMDIDQLRAATREIGQTGGLSPEMIVPPKLSDTIPQVAELLALPGYARAGLGLAKAGLKAVKPLSDVEKLARLTRLPADELKTFMETVKLEKAAAAADEVRFAEGLAGMEARIAERLAPNRQRITPFPPEPPPVEIPVAAPQVTPATPEANEAILRGLGVSREGKPAGELLQTALGSGDDIMAAKLKKYYSGGPDAEDTLKIIEKFEDFTKNYGVRPFAAIGRIASEMGIPESSVRSVVTQAPKAEKVVAPVVGLPKETATPGKVAEVSPEGIPLIKSPTASSLDDLTKPLAEGERKALGKWSPEVPIRTFDRLDEIAPGASERIYVEFNNRIHDAKVNYQEMDKWSRKLQGSLPRGSNRRIGNYAIAQQEAGAETLERMGVAVEELSQAEQAALGQLRHVWDDSYNKLNEARAMAGAEPIPRVENYTTFSRIVDKLVEDGVNLLTVNPKVFHPDTPYITADITRLKNARQPLETDIFKVFRRNQEQVGRYVHLAPHSAAIRSLTGAIEAVAGQKTGISHTINQWLDKSLGTRVFEPDFGVKADKVINRLVGNVGVATLAGYARSALIQPSAMVLSVADLGVTPVARGIAMSLSPKWRKFAKDNSKVLLTREYDVSIADALERMSTEGLLAKGRRVATNLGYMPLHWLDAFAARAGWLSGYVKATSLGLEGKTAFKFADQSVKRTHGSAALHDRANIQMHTLGKMATQFQTFVINEWGFVKNDILGIANQSLTGKDSTVRALRLLAAGTMANILYEDVLGMRSPMPTPFREYAKLKKEGKSTGEAALGGALEVAQQIPVVGYGLRYGTSPLGPAANFLTDAAAAISGRGRSPLWTYPAKLAGVPATLQIQRLLDVPGRMTTKEALMGKSPAPLITKAPQAPKMPSVSESRRRRSYLKDGNAEQLLMDLIEGR